MSSIYKLSISGIRSFSSDTQETIQFNKPLTLIVGTNGSGKTTIIECLRYATTGDLPPNSKNGAFINDPNLSMGCTETKAQIKLAFQNINRKNMILSKSLMSVKNPKTKSISFKTRENQLLVINNGEKQSISSKVADIEQMIPQQLGVSKAILNYVIFCHQDESLWPISDSSTLKKKFDEIFDSVKFIKVLENFKNINKELNVDIKLINNNVEHLKNDRVKAYLKANQINDLNSQVESFNKETEKLNVEIEKIKKESEILFNSNQDYEKILNEIEFLKQQEINTNQQINMIESTTKIIDLPIEQLKSNLNDFSNILIDKQSKIDELNSTIESTKSQLNEVKLRYNENVLKEGKLKGLKDQYERNLNLKNELVETYKDVLNIKENGQFDDLLQDKLNSLGRDYNKLNNSFKKELNNLNFELNNIKEEISNIQQNKNYMEKDIVSLTNKKNELLRELNNIKTNETKLDSERSELQNTELKLNELKSNNELSNLNDEIPNKSRKIRNLENDLEDLNKSISKISRHSETFAKLNYLNEQKNSIDANLTDLTKRLNEIFERDLGFKYNISTSEQDLMNFDNDFKLNLNSQLKTQDELKTEQIENKSKIENLTKREDQLIVEFNEIENKINELNITGNYQDKLIDAEEEYNKYIMFSQERDFYIGYNERAKTIANAKNSCLLCHREFDDEYNEKSLVLKMLDKELNKLKENNSIEQDLKDSKEKLEYLKTFEGLFEKYNELKEQNSIEVVSNELQDLKILQNEINKKILKLNKEIAINKKTNDELNELKSKNAENLRLRNELRSIKEQLSILRSEIELFGGMNNKSMEDLEILQNEATLEIKNARNELEIMTMKKDKILKDLSTLENSVKDKKVSIVNLENLSLNKINLEKSINEYNEELEKLTKSIQVKELNLNELINLKDLTSGQLKDYIEDNEFKLNEITNQIKEFENIKNRFVNLNEQIGDFENNYKLELTNVENETINYQQSLNSIESQMDLQLTTLRKLEIEQRESDNEERNLMYNIDLRNLQNDLVELNSKIETLKSQNLMVKRSSYLTQSRHLQEKQNFLQNEFSIKTGELLQIKKQIGQLQNEINRDYNQIDNRYLEEYTSLQTKLSMQSDLITYSNAIDYSIMEYHNEKMKEINRILDEVWKSTYTGNDIDSILIRADPIKSNASRSYNYRVIMIKNGTELDMRGRCSAGQRVLASIIIRLSLAECFGLNFGMIALDEPTTNLDDENIESLAKSLNKIIELRSVQKNFQLIVITHDEKFLRFMNAVQFTDHYYKIVRNERVNSTINQVKIRSIDE